MISKFEEGKYYRFTGEGQTHISLINPDMENAADGKVHKCIYGNSNSAKFDISNNSWCWESCEWEEVNEFGSSLVIDDSPIKTGF
jgi:hypothetical protein